MLRLTTDLVRTAGQRALLICLAGLDAALAVRAHLRQAPVAGQRDVVSGARTVLVLLESAEDLPKARDTLLATSFEVELPRSSSRELIEIPVVYDGPDLAEVSQLTGLTVSEVIAAHTGQHWTVAFSGFAPGFGYLAGGDARLAVPRRATSRPAVSAGAVGLAGEFSGIYPRASPGGWQLIGRTDRALWDVGRDPPALLTPGRPVRFRQVDGFGEVVPPVPELGRSDSSETSGLEVIKSGILTTVQDLGRAGSADLGVPQSGAADRSAAVEANRLVGNPPEAALLEMTLGGLAIRAHGRQLVAVSGCTGSVSLIDGAGRSTEVPRGRLVEVPDGAEVRIGRPAWGLRGYLAVRGGIVVPAVLGSRSTDLLSGLGPPPVRRGDRLPVGSVADPGGWVADPGGWVAAPVGSVADPVGPVAPGGPAEVDRAAGPGELGAGPAELGVIPGPRADWFTPESLTRLVSEAYTVTPESNRVGLRLAGPGLDRSVRGELPSEGMVTGAIQVPPSGQPVIFLADHPVTGGYPVIAVLTDESIDRAAQMRPGSEVSFRLQPS